jgi:carbohydrate-selective porin OprB
MTSRRTVAAAIVAGLVLLVACSDDNGSAASTSAPGVTICEPGGTAQAEADLPAVGSIDQAVTDLEAKLGGVQQYFEINATARLVNLWVSLNDGKLAQPWLWVDGELSSEDGRAASGGTFAAADVDFQPDAVLSKIRDEVPDAILETFYVHGDGKGDVQYSVLTSAQCGGGLDVVVGPDGAVKSVDPVN